MRSNLWKGGGPTLARGVEGVVWETASWSRCLTRRLWPRIGLCQVFGTTPLVPAAMLARSDSWVQQTRGFRCWGSEVDTRSIHPSTAAQIIIRKVCTAGKPSFRSQEGDTFLTVKEGGNDNNFKSLSSSIISESNLTSSACFSSLLPPSRRRDTTTSVVNRGVHLVSQPRGFSSSTSRSNSASRGRGGATNSNGSVRSQKDSAVNSDSHVAGGSQSGSSVIANSDELLEKAADKMGYHVNALKYPGRTLEEGEDGKLRPQLTVAEINNMKRSAVPGASTKTKIPLSSTSSGDTSSSEDDDGSFVPAERMKEKMEDFTRRAKATTADIGQAASVKVSQGKEKLQRLSGKVGSWEASGNSKGNRSGGENRTNISWQETIQQKVEQIKEASRPDAILARRKQKVADRLRDVLKGEPVNLNTLRKRFPNASEEQLKANLALLQKSGLAGGGDSNNAPSRRNNASKFGGRGGSSESSAVLGTAEVLPLSATSTSSELPATWVGGDQRRPGRDEHFPLERRTRVSVPSGRLRDATEGDIEYPAKPYSYQEYFLGIFAFGLLFSSFYLM